MSKTFKSLNDYYNYIDKILEKCMKELAEQMKIELQDFIFKNWYQAMTPQEYERTFNFLDSVKYKISSNNGVVTVEVYYDTDVIKAEYNEYTFFNQHMSLDGRDVSEAIPYWIEKGNGNSPYYQYSGIHAMEYLRQYAQQTATLKLAVFLNTKYGIKIG